ncbi:hypothetical protein HYY75_04400, partial [bacterium]|nr:hypothetical protein [bacterium]
MEKLFSPKFILWDLDGTLTYWASKTIIPRIAFCYMRLLCQKVPFLKGFIATARAYGRVLKNLGPFTNDQLFNQNMVNSLKL